MQKLEKLLERVIRRVNINLRGQDFDAGPFLRPCVPLRKLSQFYVFYGVTGRHPLHFHFSASNLAGSYFLGKCRAEYIRVEPGRPPAGRFMEFLNARKEDFRRVFDVVHVAIGAGSIIMPHTIIDAKAPVSIPPKHLVWGFVSTQKDLLDHSIPLAALANSTRMTTVGTMEFAGSGAQFVAAFQNRIDHILESNGAYFDGRKKRGHAPERAEHRLQHHPALPDRSAEGDLSDNRYSTVKTCRLPSHGKSSFFRYPPVGHPR